MATLSYFSAPLTADGGSNGVLSVSSTAPFVKGARVFLKATGLPTVDLEVAAVLSATQLAVKLQTSPSARYNSSGYTMALGATLVQPEQDVFNESTLGARSARIGKAVILPGTRSVTVPNINCTADSNVKAWVQQAADDATLKQVIRTYAEPGKFTVFGDVNATSAVVVSWEVTG